ncbi:fungal-specific transcription factor domain-containing protein [Apiosordaria backusii]|uniref:Fungal-specific transcription factor domain-containing protein n=1 Tax=Apiosordaria backusii TaxID=314023 RepID=A0AA40ED69_9PEZI|nr:fungal-specific transcription factor domain-containing protein [Apiosordaria backusii]
MPGILPMKVIKVGTSSQSRIAQACDRCRSKKIRCDGIRPCCSQCANVGFECRTSDKLSRRAFPRGYTESLEERVRALESEVRELKDLLDEKDEKIDMLSKMHSNRRSPAESPHRSPPPSSVRLESSPPPREDTFRVQASPLLLGVENSDSYFMGASSGRSFIESCKRKMQENGKSCPDFNPEAFLHIQGCYPLTQNQPSPNMRIPPRLFTDRCVNVYFQEWSPLFPVLHKPTFLRVYEEFVADPDKIKNNYKLAQLYLVFGIAALSSEQPDIEQIAACEQQWQRALEAVLMDNTMMTLQCLLLALMYCTIRADYKRLQHYKGIAVGLSHRLGLHQSQKRFSFGVLTIETRKKVFWSLYMLDCFSAALLGLPKLLKEDDIHCEFPSDTDDEYVTEKGFQPSLPGEATRLSNALALFRGSRVLAKVLEKIYPSATSHDLSLQQMSAFEAELDEWYNNLPQHLKLTFKQDKPSTDITGSRSPILALAYYYIRTLIYRPAVTSSLGPKAAPALISVGESSKHIIQIIQLLEERSMSFSFCLNKYDTLILCGMVLLYQTLDLKSDSKVLKDHEKLVNAVIKVVDRAKAPGCYDFKRVAGMLIAVDEPSPPQSLPTPPRQSPDTCIAAPQQHRASPGAAAPSPTTTIHKGQANNNALGRHASASMSETDLRMQQEKLRRISMPQPQLQQHLQQARGGGEQFPQQRAGRASFDGARPNVPLIQRDHRLSLSHAQAQASMIARISTQNSMNQRSQPSSPVQARAPPQSLISQAQIFAQMQKHSGATTSEWEALLTSIEGDQLNVYDAIYGGPGLSMATAADTSPVPVSAATAPTTNPGQGWSPDSWDLTGFNLGDFGHGGAGTAQSVLSLSEDSLSSSDDLAPSELGNMMDGLPGFRNALLPGTCSVAGEGYLVDGLEFGI